MNNRRTKSNKAVLSVLGFLILLFLYSIWFKNNARNNSPHITNGKVLKLHSGGTAGGLEFSISNFSPKHNPVMGVTWPSCRKLIHQNIIELRKYRFPVVHEKGNPSNAEILIFRDQYEKFNVAIPDSLVGVVDFMSECK